VRRELAGMATVRAYTTAVVSDDGTLQAEVLSLPDYFAAGTPGDPVAALAEQLDVQTGAHVTEPFLADLVEQIAYEAPAARRAGPGAVREIVGVLIREPVVIVEHSPANGRSLLGLASQGATGYILIAEGKPFMALAVEAGIVIVWFIAGPVKGVREGLREAAHDATKTVMTEIIENALRRRFARKRRRSP
jgi:hypothetical protein